MTRIERFGWKGAPEPGVGRVVSAHGDYLHLVCDEAEGEIVARKKKSAFSRRAGLVRDSGAFRSVGRVETSEESMKPVTGDFVRFIHNPRGESFVTAVLPRFSAFERRDPTARRKAQTLAVNFDRLLVMTALTEDFSIPRLERYLALAAGLPPHVFVAVLTKRDLAGPEETARRLAAVRALGCDAVAISAATGEGMDAIREMEVPRSTLAFVGSSGVGKSTLLNALFGEEIAATQPVQEWSGRGRHTTTSRELVMLPSGAMAVDTPGIREIGAVGEEDAVRAKGLSSHRWR